MDEKKVLIRGAGEMASGVGYVLRTAGFRVAMTEVAAPLAIRRRVSFCEAVWDGSAEVEGVVARRAETLDRAEEIFSRGEIAVVVDPDLSPSLAAFSPHVLVDATLAKRNLGLTSGMAPLVVALGPGFATPGDAHVVIETHRGHDLGRHIVAGPAEPDTGIPGVIAGYSAERVLRAPAGGLFKAKKEIGDGVEAGEAVAEVAGVPLLSPLSGVLRGLIRDGSAVREGLKVGDVDPRGERGYCFTLSEKARTIGTSVLWAILRSERGSHGGGA